MIRSNDALGSSSGQAPHRHRRDHAGCARRSARDPEDRQATARRAARRARRRARAAARAAPLPSAELPVDLARASRHRRRGHRAAARARSRSSTASSRCISASRRGSAILYVATDDPTDDIALAECAAAAEIAVRPMVAETGEVRAALARFYGAEMPSPRIACRLEAGEAAAPRTASARRRRRSARRSRRTTSSTIAQATPREKRAPDGARARTRPRRSSSNASTRRCVARGDARRRRHRACRRARRRASPVRHRRDRRRLRLRSLGSQPARARQRRASRRVERGGRRPAARAPARGRDRSRGAVRPTKKGRSSMVATSCSAISATSRTRERGSRWEVRNVRTARRSLLALAVRSEDGEENAAAIRREQKALARITHPGAVELRDAGTTELGDPYIVLEPLEGRTLDGLVAARTKLLPDDACAGGAAARRRARGCACRGRRSSSRRARERRRRARRLRSRAREAHRRWGRATVSIGDVKTADDPRGSRRRSASARSRR